MSENYTRPKDLAEPVEAPVEAPVQEETQYINGFPVATYVGLPYPPPDMLLSAPPMPVAPVPTPVAPNTVPPKKRKAAAAKTASIPSPPIAVDIDDGDEDKPIVAGTPVQPPPPVPFF